MSQKSKKARIKQKRLFIALFVALIFLAIGFSRLLASKPKYTPISTPKPVDLPADKMNPQDIWMNRVESQNKLIDQKLNYLEDVILESKKQEEVSEKEKRHLKEEIAQLKRQLETPLSAEPSFVVEDPLFSPPEEMPTTALVEFTMEDPIPTIKNVDQAVPAGTSVKALLVSSVDANCGVYSINDPIPVKLRILDDGHLPKNIDVDLKGAVIIGSAYGNLSSERVYMRLERMTQVNSDGDFVETEVAGYITGDDGKYGVRGSVVDKSGSIIKNAAISGLFGDASQILQAALGRYRIDNYLSTSVNDPYVPNTLNGATSAFDMLADYYIKRAEQIEPVIQVSAGQIVDITFTHGTEVGDLHTKDKIKAIREKHREGL